MDSLSVCILNFNGKDYLEKCLKSVPIAIAGVKLEKILIDNSSTDESWKIAEKYGFKVVFANNEHKFITGLNMALKTFTSDYILFSQADLRFKHNCISRLLNRIDDNPNSIIQPVFVDEDNRIDNAGMKWIWPGYGIGVTDDKRFSFFYHEDHYYSTDIVTSIAFMTSREVVEKVGLFDEQFAPAYYEDVDYSLRCKKLDVRIGVVGIAEVVHNHTSAFSKIYSKRQLSEICYQNRMKVIKKHYRGFNQWMRQKAIRAIQPAHNVINALQNKIMAGFSL